MRGVGGRIKLVPAPGWGGLEPRSLPRFGGADADGALREVLLRRSVLVLRRVRATFGRNTWVSLCARCGRGFELARGQTTRAEGPLVTPPAGKAAEMAPGNFVSSVPGARCAARTTTHLLVCHTSNLQSPFCQGSPRSQARAGQAQAKMLSWISFLARETAVKIVIRASRR